MKPSDLKYYVEQNSNFFDRSSMKFFGDTMRNYGVCEATVETYSGDVVECWELYRKQPVKHGLQSSAYFDKQTYKRVFPKRGE